MNCLIEIDHVLLTRKFLTAAKSMIDFYVCDNRSLTCDEPDLYYEYSYLVRPTPKSFSTSTTLGKSVRLLTRYVGRAPEPAVEIVASIAQASEPVPEDVIRVIQYTDSGIVLAKILDFESCMSLLSYESSCWIMSSTEGYVKILVPEDVSPIAKAIIARSIDRLRRAVEDYPHLLLQKTFGLTVIHLCVGWPEGLRYLLQTEARSEIDTPDDTSLRNWGPFHLAWPFSYAAAQRCSQSLELLLDAGCNLYPKDPRTGGRVKAFSHALGETSVECARVFASRMAGRKEELFALARSRLDEIMAQVSFYEEDVRQEILAAIQNGMSTSSPELDTGRRFSEQLICGTIFECLRRTQAPVHSWIKPCELENHDVYQRFGVRLDQFPIFEEYGFLGYNEPDRQGLRPIMNKVQGFLFLYSTLPETMWEMLPWLAKHHCLDLKPAETRVESRGGEMLLNEYSTGWHYLALSLNTTPGGFHSDLHHSLSELWATANVVATIAEGADATRHRDGCICPCNHPSTSWPIDQHNSMDSLSGCSPFSVLCRNYFEDSRFIMRDPQFFRHSVFQHEGNSRLQHKTRASGDHKGAPAKTRIPTWQLELLRLLTFEVLEMTHTCCVALPLRPESWRLGIFHRSSPIERKHQHLRAEPAGVDERRQLEELMAEFEEQLRRGSGSARDLEKFIFGPWQARIATFYDVNDKEINAMEQFLGNRVRTSKYKFGCHPLGGGL